VGRKTLNQSISQVTYRWQHCCL